MIVATGYKERLTLFLALLILVLGVAGVLGLLLFPRTAVYVSLATVGLALALQKYIASFFGYFVIRFSRIMDLGDRIRMGQIKGDVKTMGLLHFTLEEVGEDEKLGGELTGRLLHIPNLLVLDQPVLNYSKDYAGGHRQIKSDYIFDEVRIPITVQSDAEKAATLLDSILRVEDAEILSQAQSAFKDGYPEFFQEAVTGPRVLVHIEPQRIWVKGKFVTPLRGRNDLRTRIYLRFLKEIEGHPNIKLA